MSVKSGFAETAIQRAEFLRCTDTARILREYQQRAENLMRVQYVDEYYTTISFINMPGVMTTETKLTLFCEPC